LSLDFAGRPHKINRMKLAVERFQAKIDHVKANGNIGVNGKPVDWDFLEKNSNATDNELFAYQTLQSRAFASGKLSEEEASWLYQKLGRENPTSEKFAKLPLAEKMAITKVMEELASAYSGMFGPR